MNKFYTIQNHIRIGQFGKLNQIMKILNHILLVFYL